MVTALRVECKFDRHLNPRPHVTSRPSIGATRHTWPNDRASMKKKQEETYLPTSSVLEDLLGKADKFFQSPCQDQYLQLH